MTDALILSRNHFWNGGFVCFKNYLLNFRSLSVTQPGQPDPTEVQRQQQAKRRALARKRAQEQLRPRTPEPVEGRKHVDVQTGM